MADNRTTLNQEQLQKELLLINAAKKDPRRFNVLYDKYYHPIFLFIQKRTADEHLSADLSSQVFLKAMVNITKYEYRGLPFSAWLFRIASNEVNEFYRKNKKQRSVSLESKHLSDIVDDMESEEKEFRHQMLIELLDQLNPSEIQLLQLRYFEKRAFREVAEILDITENNAKIKVHRLIGKMKKLMMTKIKELS